MTYAQKQASDPDYCVWVAASAGTGKTKVLTDRVLRLLLEGVPAGRILCLTFTNAAAAEMANRVHRELEKWVVLDDAALDGAIEALHGRCDKDLRNHARTLFAQVLDTPDGLKIQTIHSFCQMLMRRFPLEANIAPHFKVIDEQTSEELLGEAWLRLLSDKKEQNPATVKAIADVAGWVHDSTFGELIKELIGKRDCLNYMWDTYKTEGVIDRVYQTLGVARGDDEDSLLFEVCRDEACDVKGLREACGLLSGSSGKNPKKLAAQLASWLALDVAGRAGQFAAYVDAFLTTEGEPRVKLTNGDCEAAEDALRHEQQRLIRVNDRLKSLRIAQRTEKLLHIAESVLALYKKSKEMRAFLDYNDLIITSAHLLKRPDVAPWVLYKLDGGVDHILVDEAQDTSPQQWSVIEAICEEFFSGDTARDKKRTIFVVGDEKQSIFRFQGADPAEFSRMQRFFAAQVQNAEKQWRSVNLDMSFRSTAPVLQCVDAVFAQTQVKAAITLQAEAIEHQTHRTGQAGRVELWPLVEVEKDEKLIPWQMPVESRPDNSAKRVLAEKLAATIADWLANKRMLVAKGRPVQPGDIMILVRTRTDLVEMLVKSLKQRDVPVAGVDRMILTDHLAVMDLMALGEFLLLPEDDLTLAVVLKTPFVGLSEEELFELAHGRGKASLWEALKVKKNASTSYKHAYEYLSLLLAKVDFAAPFELYSYVLEVTQGRKKLMGRLGYEVNDPVDEFLALALQYESTHAPSLQGFLHWLASGQTQIKRDLDQGQNEVRIMTVHGSKGLQAPIVFLPDTTGVPADKEKLLWPGGDDPLMVWPGNKAEMNELCGEIRRANHDQEYQEYLRLLYVALTRGEDELYITGYVGRGAVPDKAWYPLVKQAMQTIATQGEDDIWRLASEQQVAHVHVGEGMAGGVADQALPDFAVNLPAKEPVPPSPLMPSRPSGEEPAVASPLSGDGALRGKVIHMLLQYLPEVDVAQREALALRFLARYAAHFDEAQRQAMLASTLAILDDVRFSALFGPGSKAEVPVAGLVGDHVISGQIDRLVVTDDEVLIVDYKTGRIPPASQADVPAYYIRQMALYKAALEKIYPDRQVKCVLVWTEGPILTPLDDQLCGPV